MTFYDDDLDTNKIEEIEKQLAEDQQQEIKKLINEGKIVDYQKQQQANSSNSNGKPIKNEPNSSHKNLIKRRGKTKKTTDQDPKDVGEKEGKQKEITSLVKENIVDLFLDQFNRPHIGIKIKEHVEILGLDSQRFKNWLYRFFHVNTGEISSEQVENTIKILKSEAEFNENRKKLELRVAKATTDDYTFYYDLTNSNWNAVKITPHSWSIENNAPILFRRYSNQLPQVNPIPSPLTIVVKDNKIFDKFTELLNLKDNDNKLLLKCYIVSLFIPDIAKPILMLHGEQGSAKSTLQELIKMLVDPSIVKTLTFPRDINELIQKLSHNYIAYFDNVSNIKEWISDAVCRSVTGSGYSKRQLYTDDDDIIYFFQRCIGFNGINLAATKADLLDRGIIIQLERIAKEKRRKIEDIWNDFENLRPQLLGYIFDILVKVLQIKQKGGIKISHGLNRMADFEEYAEIIARCMGYPEDEFLRVYQDNIGVQIDEAIQASPLSMAVVELMTDEIIKDEKTEEEIGIKPKEPLTMTPTDLHIELENIAVTKLNLSVSKIKSWPKSSNQLSRRLNEIKTNLREKGIVVERYKDEKSIRKIKICRVSSTSPYRQEPQNQPQNPNKFLDDTFDDRNNVSSNNNIENQAQNNDFGRYDSIDDTLHIKVREHLMKEKSLQCHHKNCNNKEFNSLESYNNHCLTIHPKQPMYPELSLLEIMGLEAKGNPWEM